MTQAAQLEKAFEVISSSANPAHALLRPVLIKTMQDPATLKALGEHELTVHLDAVLRVLPAVFSSHESSLPPLPKEARLFEQRTLGSGFEDDAEAAYNFVSALPHEERSLVGSALMLAVNAGSSKPISLFALVHLLRLALQDVPFVRHVLAGLPIAEPFGASRQPRPSAAERAPRVGGPRLAAPASAHLLAVPPAEARSLGYFIGKRVLLRFRLNAAQEPVAIDGTCLDIGSTYVMLVEHSPRAEPVLFGMSSVLTLEAL